MILTEKANIRIIHSNIEHYIKIGYNVKIWDKIEIPIADLYEKSAHKIHIKCDFCDKETEQEYRHYIKYISNQGFYTCLKCKSVKSKVTNLERYGVEHILQRKESLDKLKNTMLERYNVENSANSIELQQKTKATIKEKYGVDYITQTEFFKNASKKTKKEKYNDEYYNNNKQIKRTKKEIYNDENYNNRKKSSETCLETYGVENISQNENIKEKKRKTTFKNHGVDYPLLSNNIKNKSIQTNMTKLGVPYPMMSDIIKNKVYLKNTENGKWTKYENRTDFYNYYLLVCKYTLKNKEKLLTIWNGNDYYTGVYILENFNLDSNNKNYPTIDHKKSVKYGFENDIPAEEISMIDNLCITTRSNNSSKGEKIETDFNKLNQMK